MPHHLSSSSSSSSTSYFIPHILSMSSNGCSDLADVPPHSAHDDSYTPLPGPKYGSPTTAEIAATFRQLSLSPPPVSSIELAEAMEDADVQGTKPTINWNVHCSQVAV